MMQTVGYVGLGVMGGALAGHLTLGYDLLVLDRSPAAVAVMEAKGARGVVSGAQLAREADVICLCLPRSSDVRAAIFAPGGLADGLTPGKLIIDQTSGVPGQTAVIAAELAARGVMMLDAPLSGGVPAAQAGTVTIIASGPDDAWAKGEALLHAMTSKVYRCSERVGDGQALKLVNNAIGMGFRVAALELVALGRKAGMGLAGLVTGLNSSPSANFTTRGMLVGLVENRSTTNFALSLMAKDLSEALALGLATGCAMPLTGATRSTVQMGLALLGKDAKLDDIIGLTGKLAQVEMRGEGVDDPDLQALIAIGVLLGNVIAVSECVAMGRQFGLQPVQMARILNAGSAWCAASETLLPALAAGKVPELPVTLGEACGALSALAARSAHLGTPFILPGIALALVQEAARRYGPTANLGQLTFGYEDQSASG